MTETNDSNITDYPLRQIYFYLTEGCNLKCRHCWLAPKYQSGSNTYPMMDVEVFTRVILQAKPLGLSGVKLTGGEPLMHPDIKDMLSCIRENDLRLVMETNGLLMTQEIAKTISTFPDPFVSVSLDGIDAKTHEAVRGVPGSFEKTVNGIRHLSDAGVKNQIIMSVMRFNMDQIGPMIRLAETLGVESVKFNLVQPIKRGEILHEKGETLSIEEMIDLGKVVENTLSKETRLRIDYDHPMAFRPLGKLFGEDGDGCSACGILGILGVLPDGAYALCGIGMNIPEMVFGHATKDRLSDIWEKTAILNELREGMPDQFQGVCKKCLMKHLCLGSCVAQNYYTSGHIWGAFWYCEQAYQKGVFPVTRLSEN
ncbi:MAG: SynChlorMet cassette radical SAM/SPASM protein ScmF [Proteobacteria bacterium]|nr:SynChlorMet cassette radical SAM/SPASM protein ScmF [Pseudomonadota bacterium]